MKKFIKFCLKAIGCMLLFLIVLSFFLPEPDPNAPKYVSDYDNCTLYADSLVLFYNEQLPEEYDATNILAKYKEYYEKLNDSEKSQFFMNYYKHYRVCKYVHAENYFNYPLNMIFNDEIKTYLRDPNSYERIDTNCYYSSVNSNEGVILVEVKYRAKNGFGGYNVGVATCQYYPKSHKCKVINI